MSEVILKNNLKAEEVNVSLSSEQIAGSAMEASENSISRRSITAIQSAKETTALSPNASDRVTSSKSITTNSANNVSVVNSLVKSSQNTTTKNSNISSSKSSDDFMSGIGSDLSSNAKSALSTTSSLFSSEKSSSLSQVIKGEMSTNDLIKEIGKSSIDKGKNFLMGKATSAFYSTPLNSYATQAMKTAGQMFSLQNTVKNDLTKVANTFTAENINNQAAQLQQLTRSLISDMEKNAFQCGNSYIAKAKQKALHIPTQYAKRMTYWTNFYMVDPNTITTGLINSQDDVHKEKEESAKEDQKAKIFAKIGYVTSKVTYAVNTGMNYYNTYAVPYIGYITSEGPDWVNNKLTNVSNNIIQSLYKKIGSEYDGLVASIDKEIEDIAKERGYDAAESINAKIEKQIYKLNNAKELQLTKTKVKMLELNKKAINKLKALLGKM